uniref:F-box domain-containing protein n=1 Tax=Eutreptiella gymnastica TaxID=73025 RepID=A0A7S1NC17_9EUGL
MPHLLNLADDLFEMICDAVQTRAFSHTCRRTWRLLQRRHTKYKIDPNDAEAVVVALVSRNAKVHTLCLNADGDQHKGIGMLPAGVEALGLLLKTAPSLHTLILKLCNYQCTPKVDDAQARIFASLKDAPCLRELSLELNGNDIGDCGTQTIANSLKEAPFLTSLYLDLRNNHISDMGAIAIGSLKDAPSLRSLKLNLYNNKLGNGGAIGLAALKDAPLLETLEFELHMNMIMDPGALAMCSLIQAPALRRLKINLCLNHVGHTGALALIAMRDEMLGGWKGVSVGSSEDDKSRRPEILI